SPEKIASYFAASKLATLVGFIVISVSAISAPMFTAFHALGDRKGLQRLACQSAAFMLVLAVLPCSLLIAFPGYWLDFFGPGFKQADSTLVILVLGQIVYVCCGAVSPLLAMTGNEKIMSKIFLVTAVATIGVSLLAGREWGTLGVAIATTIGIVSWNFWMLLVVRRLLGFWVLPRLMRKLPKPL
ncbi:MAG TPA: polysaccharide biosynthesis C-terminal domain-containing protein, partial [Bellilinea sp.]|nr:polysaccharide biosynthesis C-terminal domain-containing protein [Bellilinea sp.]